MKFHSQEWVDAYKEAINKSPERAKKAGNVTMNTCYVLLDCPGGVDKYETWRFVKGEVV